MKTAEEMRIECVRIAASCTVDADEIIPVADLFYNYAVTGTVPLRKTKAVELPKLALQAAGMPKGN